MKIRTIFSIILISLSVLVISILFGQLLGGYYIYNLLTEDNLSKNNEQIQVQVQSQNIEKKKVLRLEPVRFYTIQLGIFSEVNAAQATVDKLVSIGIRPFVSTGPPYKIWIGCFSDINSGQDLKVSLAKHGFDTFIGEGLINDRALKFPGSNTYMQEKFAPLLGNYNVIFNHSLKMFKSPKFSQYKLGIWQEMLAKMQQEVGIAIANTESILKLAETRKYEKDLINLKDKAVIYSKGLDKIKTTKRDEAVLQSQGHLLEMIAAYHQLIVNINQKLGTN